MFFCFFFENWYIGIIPYGGYPCDANQSLVALIWLDEVGRGKIDFHSKLTAGGEKKIGNYYAYNL